MTLFELCCRMLGTNVLLLSKLYCISGFVNGHDLSQKTMTLFELCCRMLGTNVLLLSKLYCISGFVNGHDLSQKTMTLFELCCRMLGTNVYITENVSMGKSLYEQFTWFTTLALI